MKLTQSEWLRTGRWMGLCLTVMALMGMALPGVACAQAVSTTTVQGTVYLANGQAGAGTLDVSWPAFTTANGQAIASGRISATIGQDGFVSVNLAPNLGATPAGLYYTAVYQMSNGATSTEYWVVPAAAQASLGQVRAQVMPSSQAVQAVSKAYVDQAITELTESLLTASGGTLSGPLYLNGDPTQPLQAADKHYVDSTFNLEVPIAGGSMTGPLATPAVNGVQSPVAGSPQTTLQAAVSAAGTSGAVEIPPAYAGTDSFTNPNGVYVTDLRPKGAQQFERSVKEFGAVCDGTTDDTSALQTALNYAQTHGVALTIPQGTCKTRTLSWHGESIGGLGKQVSALMGFPGQDVLATAADSTNLLSYTRLHDLTIYVDQSVDVSCSAAQGRAPAGSCAVSRLLEKNSIFAPGGNGLTGTAGIGTAWAVGNCAIAMPAATGAGGNGLRVAEIENLEIAATGADPLAAQYPGAHSTHTCAMYLAQWPQWSEFRNIDIRGLNTGIAMPALPGTAPAGLNADSNRWQNITIQATHAFTAAAGSNNVLDNVVAMAANSAATAEPPTGLVLDLAGAQQGWTVRNAVVLPSWIVVPPLLTVAASGGAVTGVTVGSEHGLGFDPYGTQVPLSFSGSCTAQAAANVRSDGSIGTISVTQGGVGCSATTAASVSATGTWDTAAPVNLIAGQSMAFLGGNLLKGNGGYTVWNAAASQSNGTQLGGGGGTLPGGGTYGGLVANSSLGTSYQVDQFPGADFGVKLQACLGAVSPSYGGTCDARNFTGSLSMASNLTISAANATVLLPCATISTASKVIVTAGTRNVALRGCALRGASTASGSQGGTVFLYSGTGAMVQVGDPTYAADTQGFHMGNVAINTTASGSATAQGLTAYRTQELDLESLYFLGNSNQTGMTLDGTGNYTGGTFFDNAFNGFQTAVNAIGHQAATSATTDWLNASTFVRLHIDCPTSAGNPIAGTYGINLQQGDGNTFTGGDVEGCSTALHLGTNAQNNTIVGLRNENSTNQVVADAGSSYNNWMSGGTMFTGQLTDNGTRNSFLDTFHRSFNGLNGDWYGSQKDATLTNHYRIGIGAGNERGLLNEIQTDYGYRWIEGYSDATAGEQFYQVQDLLNNVPRLSIGQYNNGQSSTNNQTVLNAAGTGAIVLNGSNNSGTGGVVIGSGGASESTVATINNAGNAQFNGTLQVGGASTFAGSTTVKNQADAEIDQFLWAGATSSQKESFIYKDWNGNSQWYMVKDASNNWALNSATGGLDSFKAYQSTNSGDTYINASNSSGVVRVNYETGSGAGFNIYGGNSGALYASFTGTAAIRLPGLAAGSGHNCLQIDNSGYITNTGSACGTGSGGGSGTVSSANAGQIAYYTGNGTSIGGMSAVPVTSGGTGALTPAAALANLGAQAYIPGLSGDGQATPGIVVPGTVAVGATKLIDSSSYSSLSAACSAAATANAALYISQANTALTSFTCNAPVVLPLNGLIVPFQPANGQTVTFAGGVDFTGTGQICDVSLGGNCVFYGVKNLPVGWFGAKEGGTSDSTAAVAAALTSAHLANASGKTANQVVAFNAGYYLITSSVPLYDGSKIQGANLDYGGNAGASSYTFPTPYSASQGTVIIFNPATPANSIAQATAPSGTGAGGGSMAAGTYYAVLEGYDSSTPVKHSQAGVESTGVTIDGTSTTEIAWTVPAIANATSCRLFVGTTKMAESSYFSATCAGGTYTQTATTGTTGGPDILNTSASTSLFVPTGAHPGSSNAWSGIGLEGLNIWGSSSMDAYHCVLNGTTCGVVTSLYAIDFRAVQFSNVQNVAINGFQAGVASGTASQENTFSQVHIERGITGVIYASNTSAVEATSDAWSSFDLRALGYGVYGADDATYSWSGDTLHQRFTHGYIEDISYAGVVIPRGAQEWEFSHVYGEALAKDITDFPNASAFLVGATPSLSSGYHLKSLIITGGQYAGMGSGTFLTVDKSDGVQIVATDVKRFSTGISETTNTRTNSIALSNPYFLTVPTLFSGTSGKLIGQYRTVDTASGSDVVQLEAQYIDSANGNMNFTANSGTGSYIFGSGSSTGSVYPGNTNNQHLGSATNYWLATHTDRVDFPTTLAGMITSTNPYSMSFYYHYVAASAACTGAITTAAVWDAVRSGDHVTLTLPTTTGTATATTSFVYGVALPAQFRPAANLAFPVIVKDNGTNQTTMGMVIINASNGNISVYKDATGVTNFTASAVAGLGQGSGVSISWTVPLGQ